MQFGTGRVFYAHLLICFLLACGAARAQTDSNSLADEWQSYGHDPGGMRFSPLKQIDRANVGQLRRAWAYSLPANPANGIAAFESTPLMVDDALYFATPTGQAISLDAETGKQLWYFDPYKGMWRGHSPAPNRGVAYWRSELPGLPGTQKDCARRRIFYVTPEARLFALDPATGTPCRDFGEAGSIDLRAGVAAKWPKRKYDDTSPPAIYKNLIIVGSEVQEYPSKGPSGAIRAFDARTGNLVWRFDPVPKPGEAGSDTWEKDAWKERSGANAWGPLSVDIKNGIVFLPVGSPTYDFYGADRKGKDLFGDSIVALNAKTGKLLWSYQVVHHDLWDYDVTAPPVLMMVRRGGREIPAVAAMGKTGYVFVFNRLTGKPLFPIEERPVPRSHLPGEESWPTQPFPVKPPPLSRTSIKRDDITTVTPESRQYCLQNFGSILPGRIFNPWRPTLTLNIPGTLGGANWSGPSFDPASGYLFVNVSNVGSVGEMKRELAGSPEQYLWGSKWGTYARFWDQNHYPCQQPPWGTLNAVNLSTGEIAWTVPLGVVDALEAKGIPKTGIYNVGGSMATAGGLVFIGATSDHRFRAFDSQTGKELWVAKLESNAHADPLTYMGKRTNRQFVVIAVGPGGNFDQPGAAPAGLVAYALLPKGQASAVQPRLQAQLNAAPLGAGSEPPEISPPLPAPAQPIPFSHRVHVSAGMKCEDCHQLGKSGKHMEIPNVEKCMLCHQSLMKTNPSIQKLAKLEREHQQLSWNRVYELPDFVFFSHQKHMDAKVGCAVCHGAVGDKDVLRQEKDLSMVSCVNCHRLRKASTSCGLCHNIGY